MQKSMLVDASGNPFYQSQGGTYYSAATRSHKRAKNLRGNHGGPNKALAGSLRTIQDRSKDAHRNNGLIRNGIEKLVSNEVGIGIKPRPEVEDSLRIEIMELWENFVETCSHDSDLGFYGMQEQAVRSRRACGEIFWRYRFRKTSDKYSTPFTLQALDSVYCPTNYSTVKGREEVKNGIATNRSGKITAYYMHRTNPSEPSNLLQPREDYVRVPANRIIHHFIPTWPGQLRGEPDTVAALIRATTLESYDDAELIRKETRAPFTGAVTMDSTGDDWEFNPITGEPMHEDSISGALSGDVEAGTLMQMMPGEKVEMFSGDDGGNNYESYMRMQHIQIAASLAGLPVELLTGNYKDITDRSLRAVFNQFYRYIEQIQAHYTVRQLCRRVYEMFLDMHVLRGNLNIPDYVENRHKYVKCRWVPHAWPYLHPEQDIRATVMAIDADLESHDEATIRRGRDPDKVSTQNAEAEARTIKAREKAGLTKDKKMKVLPGIFSEEETQSQEQQQEQPLEEQTNAD